jgi:alpha-L-rhamnosidase
MRMKTAPITATVLAACLLGVVRPARSADAAADPLRAEHLRAEYLTDPIGLDAPKPRLSWTLACEARGSRQTAYQVAVATTDALLDAGKPDLWDSGRVASAEQNQVEYGGKPLVSRQPCVWRVRAWDGSGTAGPWSTSATWEVGLASPSDWQAKWIAGGAPAAEGELTIVGATYESVDGTAHKDVTSAVRSAASGGSLLVNVNNDALGGDPAVNKAKRLRVRYSLGGGPTKEIAFDEKVDAAIPPRTLQYMRRAFRVDRPVVRARLYATALGLYSFQINGKQAGDHVLAPDWTDYSKRVRYQAYDVTPLVKQGANAIAGMAAVGWYAGHIGNGAFQHWGTQPCVIAQLELTHDDGSVETICTDESWRSHNGPILASDIMAGEDYDARLEVNASDPGLDDKRWMPVVVRTQGLPPEIDPQVDPPVRQLMTLAPKAMAEPTPGHYVFDLGQNMVGVARIKVSAPAGTKVTIHFAEMLNPDKTIYTTNYRGAKSTDTYVCRGGGTETWQPRFTFHGFRYVELTGLRGRPGLDAVTGVVWGSDTPSTGTFGCSDPRVNQLWSNVRWGQRGNFLSVPTDCPQRDERLGWMGDAQVFVGTAAYNADVASFFTKWMTDVDDEQTPDGQFTNTAPEPANEHGTPAWADAGVICPWAIYQAYGDRRILERHLPAMARWVDWCEAHSDGLIRDRDRGNDFGDWLSQGANTSKELLGTAFFAHSADLVARSYKVVGDDANAAKYADLFSQIRAAFQAKYVTAGGHVAGDTQTGYALALLFDLLPEVDREPAAARLADNVRAKVNHLTTGFLGVSYLLPALSEHGQAATAYTLLMQDSFPSWLFSVKHGATTIWERWDGWTPDKGFQNPGMNSFNHYSLGSCARWMYERVAGIAQPAGGVGFERVVVRPEVGGGLTEAHATYDSMRGPVASGWRLAGGRLTLTVTVPPNVTATVTVPTANPATVRESGRPAADAPGVHAAGTAEGTATFEVGSGTYAFTAVAPAGAGRP